MWNADDVLRREIRSNTDSHCDVSIVIDDIPHFDVQISLWIEVKQHIAIGVRLTVGWRSEARVFFDGAVDCRVVARDECDEKHGEKTFRDHYLELGELVKIS
ncbi:hypothetical protein GCK72_012694 [Caenorhabditis remanei]|uniref:Uncharacterized protein n=1 Tax=Caenorhabditis remanei TaxID=31234 RepID=A0A6A5GNL6_CAERE|nr:hypothetical protein GCK72_012694 [Caenorhabditis remanei]KAF1756241.1 hypothetical protein GCK72_012694 [Caenorhabditis remanei]